MYLSFYGLNEKPFATTPDPRFLYLSSGHREALAHLVYAVQDNTAFLVLTGEVGTGKTSLLQALLKQLDGNTTVAFLVNSGLSFDGILEYVLEEFGIPTPAGSRVQRLVALRRFLIERASAGQNVVLILDEAQHLDLDTLEQIRLLSNFESPTQKHLQILLVGQPELRAKLALPELRQLQQRITLRAVIPPLSPQEIRQYIRGRLQIAGARDLDLFTEAAISRIGAYAGGIPRIVNIACEHALLLGYADQTRRLDVDIAERAIRYLEDGAASRKASYAVNWRRRLPGRRLAWVRTPTVRQWAARPWSAMRSGAAASTIRNEQSRSSHLPRIGTGVMSLAVLVATILLLGPSDSPYNPMTRLSEGEHRLGELAGWVSKVVTYEFRPGMSLARSVEVLVEDKQKRPTSVDPRRSGAASPPGGELSPVRDSIGGGRPEDVRPPGVPELGEPAAAARPAKPSKPRQVSSPQAARAHDATRSRDRAQSQESTRSQQGAESADADALDSSRVIEWLLKERRR